MSEVTGQYSVLSCYPSVSLYKVKARSLQAVNNSIAERTETG